MHAEASGLRLYAGKFPRLSGTPIVAAAGLGAQQAVAAKRIEASGVEVACRGGVGGVEAGLSRQADRATPRSNNLHTFTLRAPSFWIDRPSLGLPVLFPRSGVDA